MSGDDDFKKFINNDDGKNPENSNLPFYMVLCAREKARTLTEMYSTASNILKNANTENEKKDIRGYLKKLETESLNVLRQFDMIMIEFDPYGDDNDDIDDDDDALKNEPEVPQ
jgi:hypothetical protein